MEVELSENIVREEFKIDKDTSNLEWIVFHSDFWWPLLKFHYFPFVNFEVSVRQGSPPPDSDIFQGFGKHWWIRKHPSKVFAATSISRNNSDQKRCQHLNNSKYATVMQEPSSQVRFVKFLGQTGGVVNFQPPSN